mgnify:FL=1
MAMNDVILNKTATIERCVKRIHEVYEGNPDTLTDNDFTQFTKVVLEIEAS